MNQLLKSDRDSIDQIDRDILELLARRMESVQRIAAHKESNAKAPLRDNQREREVHVAWVEAAEEKGLSGYYVGRILREILRYSRRIQEGLLQRHEDEVQTDTVRVGIQGATSSYSDITVTKLFHSRQQDTVSRVPFDSFSAVVDSLENSEIDYALLPIENTIAGSLNEVYQLIASRAVTIVDEETLPIDHCLVGLPGSTVEGLRTIRSHPVALQQCQEFLSGLQNCSSEGYHDTAAAAELILESGDPDVAAIASEESAQRLGLVILKRGIADYSHNVTRFVLLARDAETVDTRIPCKISLLFAVSHRQGSLAECLQVFARNNINLSKIESRSKPSSPWEYLFYVDIDGNVQDSAIQGAIDEVRSHTNHFKILGCYPRRDSGDVVVVAEETTTEVGSAETEIQTESLPATPRPATPPLNPVVEEPRRARIAIGNVPLGEDRFVLMAGPCAVESRQQIMDGTAIVKEAGATILRGGAFKPRSSPSSFQGLGFAGVDLLKEASMAYEIPCVTEVLRVEDVDRVARHVDAIQVGARSMQNFPLLKKLGTVDCPVLLKRGMSATIKELLLAAEYIMAGGNQRVILCERGIRTFETATRSTLDVSAVPVLKARTQLPIIVDPSHAAGVRSLVIPLALAAAAAGADGLLVEVHPKPEEALCDKDQALTGEDLELLVRQLEPIVRSQGKTL